LLQFVVHQNNALSNEGITANLPHYAILTGEFRECQAMFAMAWAKLLLAAANTACFLLCQKIDFCYRTLFFSFLFFKKKKRKIDFI
jgi:hypothetical protein